VVKELNAEVMIVGGGLGGCAAALAALRNGKSVILSEQYAWIGGQMTSQAVPPDEHPWIESCGCTESYRSLRDQVRAVYHASYPLTRDARHQRRLNPGRGFVSSLCHEPRVSLGVLESMLRPYESGGTLVILRETHPVSVEVSGDRILSVTLENSHGQRFVASAPYFIDATELGDLLPMAGVEHVTGAEARSETGEPHAAAVANPANMQAISWCFVLDYCPGEVCTIDRPADYQLWRDYVPPLTPGWGGPLLSWQATHPITMDPVVRTFDPVSPQPERGPMDLWTFRRIADRTQFLDGCYKSDIVLVNWPQIDYLPGNVIGVSAEEQRRHLEGSRKLSKSMLYWMQTEAPRPDGGTGWPGLRLRGDITGTDDGLAMAPYIRESRRLRGLFTVKEQHVGLEARCQETGAAPAEVRAARFHDTVGVGAYRIDLHPSTGGDNYIDVGSLPFQIPLGALIPQRVENLIAGGKNLSVTHITNGCYRLHPVEWNVGEAAGMLAAACLDWGSKPCEVRAQARLLGDFQRRLLAQGFELEWPGSSPL
jgi:hypothetical protein